jgi:pimeloyl-ACP methyl ester carboxylesterase
VSSRSLFIERRGSGKKLFVLGGGPGFSHDYLVPSLQPLETHFELLYIDYPGCGRLPCTVGAPTAANTVAMTLEAMVEACNGAQIDLLCHSFGTYILGAIYKARSDIVRRCVLVSPSPHSRAQCRLAEQKLSEKLTPYDQQLAQNVLAGKVDDPFLLMECLLPYYCGRTTNLPAIKISFDPKIYLSVSETLGEFDFSKEFRQIKQKLYIFGNKDFISPEFFTFTEESLVKVLNGGHFAYQDDSQQFTDAVRDFLSC